jgi:hypothetical protein
MFRLIILLKPNQNLKIKNLISDLLKRQKINFKPLFPPIHLIWLLWFQPISLFQIFPNPLIMRHTIVIRICIL